MSSYVQQYDKGQGINEKYSRYKQVKINDTDTDTYDGSFKGKHQILNEQGGLWIILIFI